MATRLVQNIPVDSGQTTDFAPTRADVPSV